MRPVFPPVTEIERARGAGTMLTTSGCKKLEPLLISMGRGLVLQTCRAARGKDERWKKETERMCKRE